MPFISPEQVKGIRETLKKEFPAFKFSVTGSNYSTVNINVKSGPINFGVNPYINHYYIAEHWKEKNPKACKFILKVNEISQSCYHGGGFMDVDYGWVPDYYRSISIDSNYIIKK